jgi:hypothetical protein
MRFPIAKFLKTGNQPLDIDATLGETLQPHLTGIVQQAVDEVAEPLVTFSEPVDERIETRVAAGPVAAGEDGGGQRLFTLEGSAIEGLAGGAHTERIDTGQRGVEAPLIESTTLGC